MRRLIDVATLIAAIALAATPANAEQALPSQPLRVCADPNNLPFSNHDQAGFENKLAKMIAQAFGETLTYTWWAQRRGFIRHTLKAGDCDLVMGVPADYKLVERTHPYYRSTYVFVTRQDSHLDISTLTDDRLRHLRIGVHLIGDDGNNTPPAHVLGTLGIVDNVRGYMIYGDYRQPDPPARLIKAVEDGDIDVAAAWGPLAGYFVKLSKIPLSVSAIEDDGRFAPQRLQFSIAMGVRKGDDALRDRLNEFIDQHRSEIKTLLESYGVPLIGSQQAASEEH
ncbi:MAG TPA: substrate-binding domain-containing protein [Bradyrhizobium sp.]|nr:substrate-binding domain-containing protein [Bradyrhizobium sp.]